MTNSTDKTHKPANNHQPPTIILFGVDEHDKPRAARFTGNGIQLLTKAAAAMKLKVCEATTTDLMEVAKQLPKGRLYSNGRGFVPYVRRDLYVKLIAACEPSAATVDQAANQVAKHVLPPDWQSISEGHLVIAQETVKYGWWEAIVVARVGDILTLRYRDYPDYEPFERHVTAVALMRPPST